MNVPSTPLTISIGIPTRNRVDYLRLAVESTLAQTYPALEVVVSDNASSDGTAAYLASITDPRLRVVRQDSDVGMVGNFNACLFAASGALFLLLSDDDVLDPEAAAALSEPFHAPHGDRVGMSWCPSMVIDAAGNRRWTTDAGPLGESPTDLLAALYNGRRGPRLSAVMVRSADSKVLGGFNGPRHGMLCDAGNWGCIALRYAVVCCIPTALVQYREHSSSLTRSAKCAEWRSYGENMHEDFLAILNGAGKPQDADRLARLLPHLRANITATVLLRFARQPGWVALFAAECWRSRRFMLTPFVARRIVRDGWKLLRK